MPRRLRTFALAAVFLPACSWLAGEIAEQKARQDALNDYVYATPIADLWTKQIAPLWEAKGCTLDAEPKVGETVDCIKGDDKAWLRVTKVGDGHRVEVEHEVERMDPEDPEKRIRERSRDYDFEWKLLRNVDPDKAAAVEAEASAKGDKAKDAAKKLQEAFE